jgi:hypothetical protein
MVQSALVDGLKDDAGSRSRTTRRLPDRSQYFGAGAAPPPALQDDLPPEAPLHDDFPLEAGAAPPLPLQELLPPAAGSVAPAPPALPPPHATMEPISIPATADTARAFAMFMSVVSSLR